MSSVGNRSVNRAQSVDHPCALRSFLSGPQAPSSLKRPAFCSVASAASPLSEGAFSLSNLFHSWETRLLTSAPVPLQMIEGLEGAVVGRATGLYASGFCLAVSQPDQVGASSNPRLGFWFWDLKRAFFSSKTPFKKSTPEYRHSAFLGILVEPFVL